MIRPVLYFRGFKYFTLKNWYGIRRGPEWDMDGRSLFLIDVGGITFGIVVETKDFEKLCQILFALIWWLVPRIIMEIVHKRTKYQIILHSGRNLHIYDLVKD